MAVCFPANKSIGVFHNRAMHVMEEDSPRPGLLQESPVTRLSAWGRFKIHNGPGLRRLYEPISHSFSVYKYLTLSDLVCAYPDFHNIPTFYLA